MIDRKELKQNAKVTLKKHYWIFFLLCLIATFIGAEFASGLDFFSTSNSNEINVDLPLTSVISVLRSSNTGMGSNVIAQLVRGQVKDSIKTSNEIVDTMKNSDMGVVGESISFKKGVFSDLINKKVSGGYYIMIYQMISRIIKSETAVTVIFSILFVLFQFFILFFIKECYRVLIRRFFLEGRIYEHFSLSSVRRHFWKSNWPKMAWTLFVKNFYYMLWALTIVMIPVKFCAYGMVPYILAENPKMKANEVITLSRKMMNGHKWEYFKIFLSLIPWYLLEIVTLGLSSLFYTNIYETAIFSEYYSKLRKEAKEKGILNADQLNDTYLFEVPDEAVMKTTYADVWELIEQPVPEVEAPKGVRGFMIKWFGIVLFPTSKDREYEENCALRHNIELWKLIAEGKRYPGRCYPGNDTDEKVNIKAPSYLRNYSLISIVLMFFAFAFVGWAWEVAIHLVEDGVFVNRGTMYGPWLPIYGAGCVMILVLLKRLRDRPILEFLSAVVLCGVVEYFTHLILEWQFGIKWWDYTGYFLNLNGRICAEGLLVFGVGGLAVVYLLAPRLDDLFRKMNVKVGIGICVVLLLAFTADRIYSSQYPNTGKGITDYGWQQSVITAQTDDYGIDLSENAVLIGMDMYDEHG